MPHFLNANNTTISTNMKVMYTSLRSQKNLRRLRRSSFVLGVMLEKAGLRKKRDHYFLVRNPYRKLESFFKNKIRDELNNETNWQRSQQILFPVAGVNKRDTPEVIFSKLSSVSFEQFVKSLPSLYDKNRHLHPQHWIESLGPVGLNIKPGFKKIIRIEDKEELADFFGENGLDLSIRQNTTKEIKEPIEWTDEMRSVVQAVYQEDFHRYQYDREA